MGFSLFRSRETIQLQGWVGWQQYLSYDEARSVGTLGMKFPANILQFSEAREYCRKLGLDSNKEWREWCKTSQRPNNIPSNPQRSYQSMAGSVGVTGWDLKKTNIGH